MTARHVLFFLRRNLRRRPGRTATAVAAIAVGVAIFHLMAALAITLRAEVLTRIESIFPERSVVVRSRTLDVGPLAFSPGLLAAQITPGIVKNLAALPEVESVWPILPLRFPAMAVGTLAGYEGSTDVIVFGAPRELVEPDVEGERGFTYADPATSITVPVLVPRYFVDMFNLGMAESQNLPQLTDRAVVGRHFDLLLGASLLLVDQQPARVAKVQCEIVGLTSNPSLMGLILPIDYVRQFNRWYHGPAEKEQYTHVHVLLRSPDDFAAFSEKVDSWGLQVQGPREMARRLRLAVNGAAAILLLFGLAVLAMVALNIANTFALIMLERRGEIGLLRAVGASRRAAMCLLLTESSAVGLLGGGLGSGAAWGAARVLNEALARAMPALSFAPEQWLDTRAGLFVFCIFLAAVGSGAATAPLLWRSVRRWPADLLREL